MSTDIQATPQQGDQPKLISELVNTYRELNTHARPLDESKLTAGGDKSARAIISRMRMDEMLFAQALKEQITGVVTSTPEGDDPVIGTEQEDDTTRMLISQFGTARATTLTLLKDLTAQDWNAKAGDGRSILDHVRDLTESDRTQLARLKQALA